jgi:hypothetical protein
MKWLITTKSGVKPDQLARKLSPLGCKLADEPPIPLGENEQVLKASGPRDLARKVKQDDTILAVHPDSEMDLY